MRQHTQLGPCNNEAREKEEGKRNWFKIQATSIAECKNDLLNSIQNKQRKTARGRERKFILMDNEFDIS